MSKEFKIQTVSLSLKSAEKIRDRLYKKADAAVARVTPFLTTVESLNAGLEDTRLETIEGTFQALVDLLRYHKMLNVSHASVLNARTDVLGKPKFFFEV